MKLKHLMVAASTLLMTNLNAQQQNKYLKYPETLHRDFATAGIAAQRNYTTPIPVTLTIPHNEEKFQKFKRMRTAGIVLTSVGAGLVLGGTLLIINGDNDNEYYVTNYYNGGYNYTNGDTKIVVGVVGMLVGALSTGGGITMWIIGSNKMKKYGGGGISVFPAKNGVGLAYKF